jgi:hypothetical protein
MNEYQLGNLRNYLKGKCDLQPAPHHVTIADSSYVPIIELADLYARLVRVVCEGGADPEYASFASSLMSVKEITGGLY